MDWKLLSLAAKIIIALVFVMLLWGARGAWKAGNKFATFVLIVLAVADGIAIYALYGTSFFSF